VEAWDTWFRWREDGELRDVSVDDTWDRMVAWLGAVQEPDHADLWRRQLRGALTNWQLLLDERLLATAGTGAVACMAAPLQASLNLAAFVDAAFSPRASFDFAAFDRTAQLAVQALDNAQLRLEPPGSAQALRIGVIGMADALHMQGFGYARRQALVFAQRIACTLAESTLRASVQLAQMRGSSVPDRQWLAAQASRRNLPAELVQAVRLHGSRNTTHTAIDSQPRLALLANNVADAIDPLGAGNPLSPSAVTAPGQRAAATGFSRLLLQHAPRAGREAARGDLLEGIAVMPQLHMRCAMQVWIDQPIDYPCAADQPPDAEVLAQWDALAAHHGVGALRCRPVRR